MASERVTIQIENGDIVLASGRMQTITNEEYQKQSIRDVCKVRKGELFYNTNQGLDFTAVFGKNVPNEDVDTAIRECLLSNDNVSTVSNVRIMRGANRNITASVDLVLADNTEVSEVIEIG